MTIAPAARLNKPGMARFARFCVVGGVGFVVDAGVLLALTRSGLMDPVSGRFVSAMIAILTTFELNRRWAFRGGRSTPYLQMLAGYIGVQGLGFGCNLLVYTLLYTLLPARFAQPLFCLAIASGIALVVNYTGIRVAVFRHPAPAGGERAPSPSD